jgi:hypothetical protein
MDAQMPTGVRRSKPRWWRWIRRTIVGGVLLLALGLTIARLMLPDWLQQYVNRTLDRSPDYDGRVGKIEVSLWRGAYSAHDLTIVKTTEAVPVPFFEGERVDFTLDWEALWNGAVRGKIVMIKPKLNFVQGPSEEETQTGVDQPWLAIIDDLYPFRIDKAEIQDGQVHFHAFHKEPPVNVYLSDLQGELRNLTNAKESADPLVATVHATGRAMRSGDFEFDMSLDPHAYRPTFDLALQLLDLDLRKLNPLAVAYGDFDFEEGTFDFVVELSAKNGLIDGYAKPLFRNAKVISLRDVKEDNPLQVLWEAMASVVGEVFENKEREQFGTRITISGELDNPRTSILEIIGNVLRNAFVQAYLPRIEGTVAPTVAEEEQTGERLRQRREREQDQRSKRWKRDD